MCYNAAGFFGAADCIQRQTNRSFPSYLTVFTSVLAGNTNGDLD
jgi:hypothetical protein